MGFPFLSYFLGWGRVRSFLKLLQSHSRRVRHWNPTDSTLGVLMPMDFCLLRGGIFLEKTEWNLYLGWRKNIFLPRDNTTSKNNLPAAICRSNISRQGVPPTMTWIPPQTSRQGVHKDSKKWGVEVPQSLFLNPSSIFPTLPPRAPLQYCSRHSAWPRIVARSHQNVGFECGRLASPNPPQPSAFLPFEIAGFYAGFMQ